MILGADLARAAKATNVEAFVFFPLLVHASDLIVSSVGIIFVRASSIGQRDALPVMKQAYLVTMVLAVVCFTCICRWTLYLEEYPNAWKNYVVCGISGIAMSWAIIKITEYYTDYKYHPVKSIAEAATTGHGTAVIAGIAVGMESTGMPVLVMAGTILFSYSVGINTGLPAPHSGLFGVACATMGMLCTAVFVLSMNNFGPIADNAGGIVEMSGEPEEVRAVTDRLDAVGNVTKAATKGYACGGSALACFILFRAFMDEISALTGVKFVVVNIAKVEVLVSALLGITMIFVFVGWSMSAVGQTAQEVVFEVRRQFREHPGIMDYTEKPDHERCVKIVAASALTQIRKPAGLALIAPVLVGVFFKHWGAYTGDPMLGCEAMSGFLVFGSFTGLLMAIFLDNAGGAWDNAKKFIECGNFGGKNSQAHYAAITGDTVGDPCKDTAGPSLHVIITTMCTTAMVLAPIIMVPSVPMTA
eukprot:TRINITY_DN11291_c0_g1_i7.p1 TRINITY_DN11291_c0_g1~~TRINITY_DN11291_c0_g1_i7.p1  ORF type:complete len:473 (-),score=129.60 TRINITY_DN11291_c0_g1_i7:207-1625(-)